MPPFNADRWRVLSPYLDEALEIAPDERHACLSSIATRDATLADDLRKMLAQHRTVHQSGFLERAVLDPGHAPLAQHSP